MTDWFIAARVADVPSGGHVEFDLDGTSVLIINDQGDFYAIENLCSHSMLPLAGGEITSAQIACPFHGAAFCLKTGDALTLPAVEGVARFPLKEIEGFIHIRDDRWD